MKSKEQNLWGIDLGGTKIEGVVLASPDNPEVLFRGRVPTKASEGYDQILSQVKKMVNMISTDVGYMPNKIGLGTPGNLIPRSGLMKNSNATALNGRPVKKDLENLLKVKLEMSNDANCFALAETKLGIVKEKYPEANVVFGVIMGTGIGGGVVVNKQVFGGHHGIAGEWGHNYLSPGDGRTCYCGKTGCVESILSGPSLEAFYHELSGRERKLKVIIDLGRQKSDPSAVQTLSRLIKHFGLAISTVVNILDPDVIVIGGGVGNVDEIYSDGILNTARYIFNNTFDTPVVKPKLGDSAGVFGAAFLASQ